MSIERRLRLSVVLLALLPLVTARAQRPDTAARTGTFDADSGGKGAAWPKKFQVSWNEYNLGFTTIAIGAGFLVDYATYNQDSLSRDQFHLVRQAKVRDSRFLLSGNFHTDRATTWQTGLFYDFSVSKWFVRQTMIAIAVPEIWGQIHIGRMKEGISLNRVMTGYDGWTLERFTFSDAAIPLLADGVKWVGYSPKAHLIWNLAGFTDWLSSRETFTYYRDQVVGRLAYLKMDSDTAGKLLHIGAGLHVGHPEHDTLQLKSKPEVSTAPNFIDTGKFPATLGKIGGLEVYYRAGPLLVGSEYYGDWVTSAQTGNPVFQGGDVSASWVVTGETRPYTTNGGYFRDVSPAHPLYKGGYGAWETVFRVSYSNLNSGTLKGGEFWRVTPAVNWYMSDAARLEFAYGFSNLTRFGLRGSTEFFQMRLQLQFAKFGRSGD